MTDLSNEPRKLEILKVCNLLSTELVGTHDEDMRCVHGVVCGCMSSALGRCCHLPSLGYPPQLTPALSLPLAYTHSSFSYAYKFVTNQGTFICFRWDVFTSGALVWLVGLSMLFRRESSPYVLLATPCMHR